MAKRTGFFKRIGIPVILTIGRSNQLVRTDDVILADFDAMMEKEGWQFLPKFNPIKEKMEIQKVNPSRQAYQSRQVPPAQNLSNQLINISNMTRRELTTPPRAPQKTASEQMIDASYNTLIESNTIRLGSIEELDERVGKKQSTEGVVINLDALKLLKKYTNKDWLSLTKDKCKEILNSAHIDYSHIPSEKWELVKFIKSIIKDIDVD